jgi:hypothetical protein
VVEHAFQEFQPLESPGNARKVAARRMTLGTSARAIEIAHPSFGVSGLEIGDVNGTSAPFLCIRLPIMNECNYRR